MENVGLDEECLLWSLCVIFNLGNVPDGLDVAGVS